MANKLAWIKLYVITGGEVADCNQINPPVLACTGLYWLVVACSGFYSPVLAYTGLY